MPVRFNGMEKTMFVRYVKFEDAKRLVDAVNNAKTQHEHDRAKYVLEGYKMRCDQEGLRWPGCDLDLSLPDDGRPVCCGQYMDWKPADNAESQ